MVEERRYSLRKGSILGVVWLSALTLGWALTGVVRADEAQAPAPTSRAENPTKPPTIIMPLREVEPPRNVPAAQYRSPYCTKWNDGCTECARASAKDKAACAPMSTAGQNCSRRIIFCQAQDDYVLHQICKELLFESFPSGGANKGHGALTYLWWTFKEGRWMPDGDDSGLLVIIDERARKAMKLRGYMGAIETRSCAASYKD